MSLKTEQARPDRILEAGETRQRDMRQRRRFGNANLGVRGCNNTFHLSDVGPLELRQPERLLTTFIAEFTSHRPALEFLAARGGPASFDLLVYL